MRRGAQSCALGVLLAGCSVPPCHGGAGVTPLPGRGNELPVATTPSENAVPPPIEPATWAALEDALKARRAPKRNAVAYVPQTDAEEQAYRAWIRAAARAAEAGSEPPARAPEGFVLEQALPVGEPRDGGSAAPLGGERKDAAGSSASAIWLLAEHPDRRRGAAALLLRVGEAAPLIVEAPHTFHDMGTLPIAVAVFEVQRARALIINTVHRTTSLDAAGSPAAPIGEGESENEADGAAVASDFAHAARSSLLAAHDELLAVFPKAPAVQLHGFADRNAPDVQVIVSAAGTLADTAEPARALAAIGGLGKVRRYPEEIQALGGTTNVAAKRSRAAGAAFLHFEIARTTRDELVRDIEKRGRFAAAVTTPTPAKAR